MMEYGARAGKSVMSAYSKVINGKPPPHQTVDLWSSISI